MPWPTVLHKLVSDELDDIWEAVIQRAKEHPEEVGVQGAGYGQTALHVACYRYPPVEAIRALLEACPDAAVAQNSDGETALHLASAGASEEVQLVLLQTRPEVVGRVDKYGDSPLHLAASSGASIELLRQMVEADTSVITLPNKRGIAPFFLLSRGYEKARGLEDVMPEEGEYADEWERATMFLKAAYFGTLDVPANKKFRILHAAAGTKCPRALLRVAARLFPEEALVKDEEGRTPLAIAAAAEVFDEPKLEDDDEFDDYEGADEDEEELIQGAGGAGVGEHLQHAAAAGLVVQQQPQQQQIVGETNNIAPLQNGQSSTGGVVNETNGAIVPKDSYLNCLNNTLGTATGFLYPSQMPQSMVGGQNSSSSLEPNSLFNDPQNPHASVIDNIVALNPRAASMADAEGRLPLTMAVETGKCWDDGLRSILWAAPRALETRDIKTRMYPFMVAAVGDNASCTTVYELIRTLPELVSIGIPPNGFETQQNDLEVDKKKDVTESSNIAGKKRKFLGRHVDRLVEGDETEADGIPEDQNTTPLVPQCRSKNEIRNACGWSSMNTPAPLKRPRYD